MLPAEPIAIANAWPRLVLRVDRHQRIAERPQICDIAAELPRPGTASARFTVS